MKNKFKKIIRRILIKPIWSYFIVKPTSPIGDWHGFDRGTPIDRFYIENFLESNSHYIQGSCLEFLNKDYITKFGRNIEVADVVDIDPSNKDATIISDIRNFKNISDESYDCIILTQVLHFIDDLDSAVSELHRILKKGGVILITVPFLNRIDKFSGKKEDYWRFTESGLKYILSKKFSDTEIEGHGNVYGGIMSYVGACIEESSKRKLSIKDEMFPVIISGVVKK